MKPSIQSILLALCLSFVFLSCSQQQSEQRNINIIPKPVSFEKGNGNFILDAETKIIYPDDSSIKQVADFFISQIAIPTGFKLQVGSKHESSNVIVFTINENKALGKEEYQLTVNKESIVVQANDSKGLFYGMQTLLQLLPAEIFSPQKIATEIKWDIPVCKITDEPRFAWRGMHLDVSRHFFPKEFIKRYIDLIAMHKMNVFHWHLTDDNGWRIEIKKYPLLTDVSAWRVNREDMPWRKATTPPKPGEKADLGGFYTQGDIREIVQYAADRQIEIIPEIEMPGHTSEVFAAYPELSCTGKKLYVQPGSYWPNTDIFCAGNEEVFTFIENVLDEVAELFPSKYIHIGGDEADKTKWGKCSKCQKRINDENLEDENELQSWFIKRIEKYLISKNKRMIGWDEILEGGLAPEATVMSWRGVQGGIEAARQGHDVVMSPGTHCYFDHYQADPEFEPLAIGGFTTLKKVYSFDPIPTELNTDQAKHVLGGQGNVWTEYISTPEHAEYMAVPRMTALAEVLWTPKKDLDWDCFRKRMLTQYKRFDLMDVNYSKGSWKVDIQPAQQNDGGFSIVLESEQLEPIHYTVDGGDPSPESPIYGKPIKIDKTTTVKAGIFVDGKLKEKISEKTISMHKALGKKGVLKENPSKRYFAKGAASLTDGLTGSGNFRDGYWLGFKGKDMDLEIDLGETIEITSISEKFFQRGASWVFLPKEVVFTILDNDKNILSEKILVPRASLNHEGKIVEVFEANFEKVKGRYVQVMAKSIKTCPAWHEGAGGECWIFTDEVIVE